MTNRINSLEVQIPSAKYQGYRSAQAGHTGQERWEAWKAFAIERGWNHEDAWSAFVDGYHDACKNFHYEVKD